MSGAGTVQGVKQQGVKHLVETRDPADAGAAQGVAVVGQFQSHEACLVRLWSGALLPVLHGDFQCDLDRRRTIVREEHVPQALRREIDQAFGQPDGRGVGHAQRGDVSHLV